MVVYEIEAFLYKEPARRQKVSVCNPTFKGAVEDLLLMLDHFGKLDDVTLCAIFYWGTMEDDTLRILNSWYVSVDEFRPLVAEVVE